MEELRPAALAESGDPDLDARDGVQEVNASMIMDYVMRQEELPLPESARAFAEWLDAVWASFNEEGAHTTGEVIAGALHVWRGK